MGIKIMLARKELRDSILALIDACGGQRPSIGNKAQMDALDAIEGKIESLERAARIEILTEAKEIAARASEDIGLLLLDNEKDEG